MVKRSTFRIFCYVVGFIGLVIISISKMGTLATVLGILVCFIFMGFGYAVTSERWSRHLIGEQVEGEKPKGGFGGD